MLDDFQALFETEEELAEGILLDFLQTFTRYVEASLTGENHAMIRAIIENMEVEENEKI